MFIRYAPHRGGRAAAVVLGLLVLAAVIVIVLVLRGGGAAAGKGEIPSIDLTAVEPALARRIEERTAAVTNAPGSADAWGQLGVAFEVHDYRDEAIPCYERAASLDDGNFLWHYLLGYTLRETDSKAALAHLQRADALRNDYAPVPCLIGHLQLEANEIDAADDSFARALGLDDDMIATLLGRARVALARNDSKSALFYLDRADKLRPKRREIDAIYAEAHRMAGSPDDALRHAGAAGDDWRPEPLDDPIRNELWRSEGVTMEWRRRRSNEAVAAKQVETFVKEWEDAMREQPASSEPHIELGEAYGLAEEYDLALAAFDNGIALDASNAAAHFGRGRALLVLGREEEGIAALQEAISLDPRLRGARLSLSRHLMKVGRTDEGLEVLRAGAELSPDDVDVQLDFGTALRQARRPEQARAVLDRVLTIDPGNARATFERTIIIAAGGDLSTAVDEFKKVTVAAPRISGAHMNLGQAYLAMGRTEEAIAALRTGVAHHPNDFQLLGALAWIYATNVDAQYRDGERAVSLAKRLVGLSAHGNSLHLDILAAACAERGHWQPAISYASNAVELLSQGVEETNDETLRQRMMDVQARLEMYHEKQPYRDLR